MVQLGHPSSFFEASGISDIWDQPSRIVVGLRTRRYIAIPTSVRRLLLSITMCPNRCIWTHGRYCATCFSKLQEMIGTWSSSGPPAVIPCSLFVHARLWPMLSVQPPWSPYRGPYSPDTFLYNTYRYNTREFRQAPSNGRGSFLGPSLRKYSPRFVLNRYPQRPNPVSPSLTLAGEPEAQFYEKFVGYIIGK